MLARPGGWAAAGLLLGSAAAAQDVRATPLADARLRYELVALSLSKGLCS